MPRNDDPVTGPPDDSPPVDPPPVEGVDYAVEGGRWVMLRAYLLRRGTCCGSGCRHCPYGRVAGRTAAVGPDAEGTGGRVGGPRQS